MGELTQNCPKPMLRVGNKPLLEYIVNNFKKHSINHLGINLHFFPQQIKNYFGDGSDFGVKIHYQFEDMPTGTAGGVKKLEKFLEDSDPFIVQYGDVLIDLDLRKLVEAHKKNGGLATIVLHKRSVSNSLVKFDENFRITSFLERPQKSLFVLDFPKDIFPYLISQKQLFAFPFEGKRISIDTPDRLNQASEMTEKGIFI
jgi:NDP-sugar pyrophosphorylase family protein